MIEKNLKRIHLYKEYIYIIHIPVYLSLYNSGLLRCRWILYQLSHKGSPRILE